MKKVRDILTPYAETVRAASTVQDAAGRLRAFDIGVLPVVESGHLVGIVTDRDLTIRVTAFGRRIDRVPVRDAMSCDVICCGEEDDVEEAIRLMSVHQIRRLPVLDAAGRASGIVTLRDIALAGYPELAAGVTAGVIYPAPAGRCSYR
jgi:CBS domain-containing protein